MSFESATPITSEFLKKFLLKSIPLKLGDIYNEKYQTREEKISTISKWYKSQRLVMVLGAGSSVPYGLPDWNTLLQKILLIMH